jgi:hypothetical protein
MDASLVAKPGYWRSSLKPTQDARYPGGGNVSNVTNQTKTFNPDDQRTFTKTKGEQKGEAYGGTIVHELFER